MSLSIVIAILSNAMYCMYNIINNLRAIKSPLRCLSGLFCLGFRFGFSYGDRGGHHLQHTSLPKRAHLEHTFHLPPRIQLRILNTLISATTGSIITFLNFPFKIIVEKLYSRF